ncbi:putative AlkP superfamily pyrophosphatase or phosphodiesterase [Marinobacterium halophilum]|uniref:Putative AlkP superfamily pyrophosphatase or phosphodiesterase n=1 Tax=Marinobacterium halophilum TaxID=267374 RepID=A0A2P8F3B5_9GAMM|nr:alkaline phosphatase family protein [Marinobacterium halophilum]PSL16215.1 putative AlkP superfamily pyrophosphatase or phosphodiesterase [Marinobacterium halophilum]
MGKLIMIMIDGISADHFEHYRQHLPNLDRLARTGTQLQALKPEMCGTSCPGRTSMITGVSPAEHGIYGNHIWTDDGFRWANPYDVRGDTLPALAVRQGLDVANLGYGMVRPEDCNLYIGPWWADEMLMRGKDATPEPADEGWLRAASIHDPEGRLAALDAETVVSPNRSDEHKLQLGMLADQQLLDLAAGLAGSEQAPDFILLEIAITDYFLHKYGADHDLSRWSLRTADAQIGTLLARLEHAGVLQQYNFAICSDHGHAPMPKGLYVDRLLGHDINWSSEGGVLLIRPANAQQAKYVTDILVGEGIEPCNTDFMPATAADELLAFTVPEDSGISFEAALPGTDGFYGPSKYRSNHGMRPGTPADYRFCIFSGPDIPQKQLGIAECIRFAPTLADILGVETPWAARSLLSSNVDVNAA